MSEILASRRFSVPRERLFRAFSDPAQLARWWGPRGFTNTFHEFDLRPGGSWRFFMHGPDGTDYVNESVFAEVTEPGRIVFDHLSPPKFRMTITFESHGAQSTMTWRMRFASAKQHEQVRSFVSAANEENFDRLEALLTGTTP